MLRESKWFHSQRTARKIFWRKTRMQHLKEDYKLHKMWFGGKKNKYMYAVLRNEPPPLVDSFHASDIYFNNASSVLKITLQNTVVQCPPLSETITRWPRSSNPQILRYLSIIPSEDSLKLTKLDVSLASTFIQLSFREPVAWAQWLNLVWNPLVVMVPSNWKLWMTPAIYFHRLHWSMLNNYCAWMISDGRPTKAAHSLGPWILLLPFTWTLNLIHSQTPFWR